ncbi:uncharacterized protein DS421_14g456490 [Arachis hypogaea]|nr:uncharacterized protein DS421_14g456490 [Arachis hypogaea]
MVYIPSISYSRHIVLGHRSADVDAYLLRAKGGWIRTSVVRSSAVHVPVSSRGFPNAPVSSSSTFPPYPVVRCSTAPSPRFQVRSLPLFLLFQFHVLA